MNGHQNGAFSCLIGALNRPRKVNGYGADYAIRNNMKNKLMPLWDKIMLRKRYIIECINHLLKDKGNLVHSRHRSVSNFLMNLIAALGAYCFFDNKPEAIQGYCIEDTNQLSLF